VSLLFRISETMIDLPPMVKLPEQLIELQIMWHLTKSKSLRFGKESSSKKPAQHSVQLTVGRPRVF